MRRAAARRWRRRTGRCCTRAAGQPVRPPAGSPGRGRTWRSASPTACHSEARPGQLQRSAGAFWSDKQTWNDGAAGEVALRLQLLHQLLERQVLVGVGRERRRRAPAASSSANVGSPERSLAQHQGVDEEADQPLDLGAVAVGDRRADDDVGLAGVAAEQGLEGGEQGHEERRAPAARLSAASAGGQLRGGSAKSAAAPRWLCTAAAAGRRQLEHGGRAGEPLAPVAELRLQHLAAASQRRCQTAKSAYCTGSAGSGDGSARRGRRRRARPARCIRTPIDQPSATMWCRVEEQHGAPRRPGAAAAARSSGPACEVERRAAPPRRPAAAASRLARGSRQRPRGRSAAAPTRQRRGWMTWTGSPSRPRRRWCAAPRGGATISRQRARAARRRRAARQAHGSGML